MFPTSPGPADKDKLELLSRILLKLGRRTSSWMTRVYVFQTKLLDGTSIFISGRVLEGTKTESFIELLVTVGSTNSPGIREELVYSGPMSSPSYIDQLSDEVNQHLTALDPGA